MTLVGTLKNVAYIALFIILLPLIPLIVGGIQQLYNRYIDPRALVGVLPVKGVLYDSNYHIKQLNTFFKDDAIKAILLKIECPGSAAGTGHAIFNELIELKKTYPKPVIALVENVCASGGYYIASAADYIIASPMAMIGSIGVAMPYFFQFKDFVEYHKIKYVPLAAGDYKNSTNPFTEITPQQKKMLQSVLDDSYDQFASDIAEHRRLSLDTKDEWANGKIFNGRQAFKLGLVDALGSSSQATQEIKERAGITNDIKWTYAPSRSGFWSFLSGSDDEQSLVSSCMNEFLTLIENRYSNHTVS